MSSCSQNARTFAQALAEVKPAFANRNPEHEAVQWLPNELVLQCLLFIGRSFCVFPQLSPATHRVAVLSPEYLGVLELNPDQFVELARQPKPRCVGNVHVGIRAFLP